MQFLINSKSYVSILGTAGKYVRMLLEPRMAENRCFPINSADQVAVGYLTEGSGVAWKFLVSRMHLPELEDGTQEVHTLNPKPALMKSMSRLITRRLFRSP